VKAKGVVAIILSWNGAYEIGVIGVLVRAIPQYLNEVSLHYALLVTDMYFTINHSSRIFFLNKITPCAVDTLDITPVQVIYSRTYSVRPHLRNVKIMCTVQAALNRPAKRGSELPSPPPRSGPASPLPTTPIKQEAAAAPFGDSGTAAGGGSMEDMASSLTPERVDSWGIIKAR
jgi:hypothetical protein